MQRNRRARDHRRRLHLEESRAAHRGIPRHTAYRSRGHASYGWNSPELVTSSLAPLPELNLPPTMSESLIKRHPLQRLPSPSRGISALVHVSALVPWFGLPLRSMADTLRWRVLRAFSGLSSCMYYDCNTRSTSEESMTNEFQACMKIPIRRRWSLQSKNFVDNWC